MRPSRTSRGSRNSGLAQATCPLQVQTCPVASREPSGDARGASGQWPEEVTRTLGLITRDRAQKGEAVLVHFAPRSPTHTALRSKNRERHKKKLRQFIPLHIVSDGGHLQFINGRGQTGGNCKEGIGK